MSKIENNSNVLINNINQIYKSKKDFKSKIDTFKRVGKVVGKQVTKKTIENNVKNVIKN